MSKLIILIIVMIFLSPAPATAARTLGGYYSNNGGKGIVAPLSEASKGSKMYEQRNFNANQSQDAFDSVKEGQTSRKVEYNPFSIFKIRLREAMESTIVLDSDVIAVKAILGDPEYFTVKPVLGFKNILSIQGKTAGTDTSLKIITSKGKVINLYLRTDPITSEYIPDLLLYIDGINNPLIDSNSFNSSDNPIKKSMLKKEPVYRYDSSDYIKALKHKNIYNDNYILAGDMSIAPSKIYDDGSFTYFVFDGMLPDDDLPVIRKIELDSSGKLVDAYISPEFNTKHKILIAKTLSQKGWTLLIGGKILCVRHGKGS